MWLALNDLVSVSSTLCFHVDGRFMLCLVEGFGEKFGKRNGKGK